MVQDPCHWANVRVGWLSGLHYGARSPNDRYAAPMQP
jgi:hypothetical protein